MRLNIPPLNMEPLKRLPLRITALTTAVAVLVPALLVLVVPRRLASGLDRLLPEAALLQSFPARPGSAPPPLWQQRLGPQQAAVLWRRQRRLWWQFWGPHGDAGAYLVFAAPPSTPLPADALRVDDLLVVAPSPLARQLLQQQLRLRRRPSRGLNQRCSEALMQREAVHWTGTALAQMLGPLSPLALSLQQGCLLLSSEGSALLWQGEAEASRDSLQPAPARLAIPAALPRSGATLLELRGRRLELLLRGLLSTALLRNALAERYGLGPEQLRRLQGAPFVLQLQPQAAGTWRAGLSLLVRLPGERQLWERWLADLSRALEQQGLAPSQPGGGVTLWGREDGTSVGGWRWLKPDQLLLFLGPSPGSTANLDGSAGSADWQLSLSPAALQAAQLLPPGLPLVVQRSQALLLQGRAAAGSTALSGRLELR